MTGDNSCYLSMNEDTEPGDGVLAVPLDTERQLRKQGYGPLYWLSPYVRRGASLIPDRTPLRMSLRPRHATP